MQREAIEFIAKQIQKEDNEKQRAFLRLKRNANKLEANVFGKFIKANKDYKNDDPEEISYVVYYDLINLDE